MANRERSNSFNTIKYFILNATTYLTNTVLQGLDDVCKGVHKEVIIITKEDYNDTRN